MEGKPVLVTGGAGYVGSHTVVELLNSGFEVVVIDNMSNGCMECLHRIEKITGKSVTVYTIDLLDTDALRTVFDKHSVSMVIHFAALKSVGESVKNPLAYYRVNVTATINLMEVMVEYNVTNLIFSSSATVYGDPQYLPMDEAHPVGNCVNPYATTKHFVEEILSDQCRAEKDWNVVVLRYFNPVGAHKSGMIGEDPQGTPNNLTPFLSQVAIGMRAELKIFGNDYNTHDGTGVRDYVHVLDVAMGHIAAVRKIFDKPGYKVYNLGRGQGSSVLDVLKAFEKASGAKIPYSIMPRRSGDVAAMAADAKKAESELKWKAMYSLEEMCEDLWRWQTMNPTGYRLVNGTSHG